MRHKPWHCSGRMGTPNKSYSEQIDLHRFEHLLTPRPAKLFHWSSRKHNSDEARAKVVGRVARIDSNRNGNDRPT